jgi:hypothetical protein
MRFVLMQGFNKLKYFSGIYYKTHFSSQECVLKSPPFYKRTKMYDINAMNSRNFFALTCDTRQQNITFFQAYVFIFKNTKY